MNDCGAVLICRGQDFFYLPSYCYYMVQGILVAGHRVYCNFYELHEFL